MTETHPRALPGHTYRATATPASRPAAPVSHAARAVPVRTAYVQPTVQPRHVEPQRVIVQQPRRVEPQRIIVQPRTTQYYTPPHSYPRGHYQQRHQYQSRPPQSGNLLAGLFGGFALGSMFSGDREPNYSTPANFMRPEGPGLGEPLHPAVFESMMNAAMEGRPESRLRMNNGEEVPTTPEQRQMFQQVVFNLLRPTNPQMDERALFIPGILDGGANPMPQGERGTHITHFNGDFTNPAMGEMVRQNADLLREQYAQAYQEYRDGAQQQAAGPRYQQASMSPMSLSPMSSMTRMFRVL